MSVLIDVKLSLVATIIWGNQTGIFDKLVDVFSMELEVRVYVILEVFCRRHADSTPKFLPRRYFIAQLTAVVCQLGLGDYQHLLTD